MLRVHADDIQKIEEIYGNSHGIYNGCYLYGVRVIFDQNMTRGIITLI